MAVAFAAAAIAVLVLGAWVRARARQASWLRQAGGFVVAIAAPVGLAASAVVGTRGVVVAAAGLGLAALGAANDRVALPRWIIPAALVLAAVAITAAGLRFPLAGIDAVDAVWTVAWLVALTLAVAGVGNADGLLPGVGAAAGLGICALAGFAGQSVVAAPAAALVGSCIGFLAYNVRPASLYIGRGGSLYLGITLASLAIWAEPAIDRPESILVPLLFLGLPLLDGAVVVGSRLRHRRRLATRYRDHLAHRFVTLGMRPGPAIAAVVVIELIGAGLALFVGRGVVSVPVGAAAGLVLFGVVWIAALRAPVSSEPAPGFRPRVWLIGFGILVLAAVATVPAVIAGVRVRDKVDDGRELAQDALRAARDGETEKAAALFAEAGKVFDEVGDDVRTPLTVPALALPIVGPNVHAARELADIGSDLARAGETLTASVDPDKLRIVDGRIPLEEVAAVEPKLEEASTILVDARDRLADLQPGYLLDPISDGIAKVQRELDKAAQDSVRAAAAAKLAPAILGQGEPRQYFLAIQNPAELRGTGGLIGNWGILTTADGKVSLDGIQNLGVLNYREGAPARTLNAPADYVRRYGRYHPETEWHPVNISPDWPTVAGVIADLYPQSGGAPVDGVIAVDPVGLQALLELTGPIEVEDWPERITAENVLDVTLRDAYSRFDQGQNLERKDFLGEVADVAVDKATNGDLGRPARVAKYLGQAAHEGHISLWFADPAEERVARTLDVAGKLPSGDQDSLLVVDINGAGNKLDYYLNRTVEYRATIDPSGDRTGADVDGVVTVGLTNTAPTEGLPRAVSGPAEGHEDQFVAGQNRSTVSVYTPLTATGVQLQGQDTGYASEVELGRNVYSVTVDLMPQQSTQIAYALQGSVRLAEDGWYELTLVRQPTLRADAVTLALSGGDGFRVAEVKGAGGLKVVDGEVQGTIPLDRTRVIRVRLEGDGGRGIWERLQDGP